MSTTVVGRDCKSGHGGLRYAISGQCVACKREYGQRVYQHNAAKDNARCREYHRRNAGRVKERNAARREAKRETLDAQIRKWRAANRGNLNAWWAQRRAAVARCTPLWADRERIREIYELAAAYRASGHDVHVDHIVPLKGKTVCGLHVAENLQILSAAQNLRKGNILSDLACKHGMSVHAHQLLPRGMQEQKQLALPF